MWDSEIKDRELPGPPRCSLSQQTQTELRSGSAHQTDKLIREKEVKTLPKSSASQPPWCVREGHLVNTALGKWLGQADSNSCIVTGTLDRGGGWRLGPVAGQLCRSCS